MWKIARNTRTEIDGALTVFQAECRVFGIEEVKNALITYFALRRDAYETSDVRIRRRR